MVHELRLLIRAQRAARLPAACCTATPGRGRSPASAIMLFELTLYAPFLLDAFESGFVMHHSFIPRKRRRAKKVRENFAGTLVELR